MRYKFHLLLILLFSLNVFYIDAQTAKIDSLENLLQAHMQQDTTRINLLNETANAFQDINPDISLKYLTEALEIVDTLDYKKGKAEAFYQLSSYYYTISEFNTVLEYAEKSLTINEEIDNKKGIAKNLHKIGNIYYFQGNIVKAMDYLKKALDINIALRDSIAICYSYASLGTHYCDIGNYTLALEYEKKALELAYKINNEKAISYALNNLGFVYDVQGNFPKALEYYQKSFWIDESLKDYKNASIAASNIAFILRLQGNYTDALAFCQKGLDYAEQIGFKTGLTYNYEYMGLIYKAQGNYAKAWESHKKALSLQEEIGNKTGVANGYKDLAELYSLQGMLTEAIAYYNKSLNISKAIANKQIEMKCYVGLSVIDIKLKNYYKAQEYSKKAFIMANDIGNVDLIKQSAEVLAQSKEALGQYKDAYNFHVIFKNMSDSLYNEENIRTIANLEYKYKYEKEKEVLELEQQKKDAIRTEEEKQQKTIRNSFIVGFILMLVLVLVILFNFLQKRKANLILAEQKKQIEDTNEELTLQKEEIQIFAHKLEKANKTKDKFFSIIAHDLKSPFTALVGFSELLLKNHKEYNDDKRETYIKFINDGSIKTYKLLENLLTWAQSQTGRIQFAPEKININTLINETISLLIETAGNKRISFITDIEKDLSVNVDKNMINTVIRNLVSNAIKFTPKGGDITIKSRTIKDERNQAFAEISVRDRGVGISSEIQSKLFKITETITTKGTEAETGTGLGLIICKEFVDKHGGKIWVESEAEKGSEFLFTIPLFN